MDLERRIARIAEGQLGLVTLAQAVAVGATTDQARHRVRTGRWRRARRSVYVINGSPPTWQQAALAVCLAIGEGAWLSHRTAARAWSLDLPGRPPGSIEVLVPTGRQRSLPGVVCHRSLHLPMPHLTRLDRLPLTTVARTIVDCAGDLPHGALGDVVDDAVRSHRLRIADLAAAIDDVGSTRSLGPLRGVVAARTGADYHPGGSARERRVLHAIRRAGLPAPVHQHPVTIDGQRRTLDFAYPPLQVGLEFDGFAEHGRIRSTFDDDRVRGNGLALAGWLILHVTSAMTDAEIASWVARALALRQRQAS